MIEARPERAVRRPGFVPSIESALPAGFSAPARSEFDVMITFPRVALFRSRLYYASVVRGVQPRERLRVSRQRRSSRSRPARRYHGAVVLAQSPQSPARGRGLLRGRRPGRSDCHQRPGADLHLQARDVRRPPARASWHGDRTLTPGVPYPGRLGSGTGSSSCQPRRRNRDRPRQLLRQRADARSPPGADRRNRRPTSRAYLPVPVSPERLPRSRTLLDECCIKVSGIMDGH